MADYIRCQRHRCGGSKRLQKLDAEFKTDMDLILQRMDSLTEQFEQVLIRPSKIDIQSNSWRFAGPVSAGKRW